MSPDRPFRVPLSGAVADLVRRLRDEASDEGRFDEFVAALQTVTARLESDPLSFGEEREFLPVLRLTVRLGIVLPVAVEFIPVAASHLVIVRTFRYVRPG